MGYEISLDLQGRNVQHLNILDSSKLRIIYLIPGYMDIWIYEQCKRTSEPKNRNHPWMLMSRSIQYPPATRGKE